MGKTMARNSDANKGAGGETEYEVGRNKPHRHTRYKPGQSGNPSGKRKPVPNLRDVCRDVFATEINLSKDGKSQKAPLIKSIVYSMAQRVLHGDMRAAKIFFDLAKGHGEPDAPSSTELPAEDDAILRRALGLPEDLARPQYPEPDGEEPGDD